ncbi:MAG TPA: rod shape-determining protein [Oligoflexia bacterium]|nr:rod shape-determining protein [Oligoflexia bacterium]HMP26728.1 rod shape-determining protein [Oligoflexia bacterium]
MFKSAANLFSGDLAVDLGTANTLVYLKGQGIVCNEPSVVAVQIDQHSGKRKVVAVGHDAKMMVGRTPDSISAIRPIKEGVIADFEMTEKMLRELIRKAQHRNGLLRPRIIICVPHGITEVEKRAVKESAQLAGAREVYLIEELMAAAIGAGLPVTEACGNMLLDIGGGTSEIAIISLTGVVFSRSIRVGGDKMEEAIADYVKRHHNILIGERTAEQLKIAVGSALPTGQALSLEVKGRDIVHGVPTSTIVSEQEVREALQEPLYHIIGLVKTALEKTPPELASDIADRGITLTGGGALLRNIDRLIARETGLPVVLVEDPITAVVLGSGAILDKPELLRTVAV